MPLCQNGRGVETKRNIALFQHGENSRRSDSISNIFVSDGVFLFNSVHNIDAKGPVENIVVMVER
jgi:hypothetical protein